MERKKTAGYSGTPLPKKLGIKPEITVGLVDAPDGFEGLLAPIPDGAVLKRQPRKACDLVIWFTRSASDLRRIRAIAKLAATGLWIAWPKKASGVPCDMNENDVRRVGLENGLVDYKIAAIDATWAGLKFAHRSKQ